MKSNRQKLQQEGRASFERHGAMSSIRCHSIHSLADSGFIRVDSPDSRAWIEGPTLPPLLSDRYNRAVLNPYEAHDV
jgi:hypothetical protein